MRALQFRILTISFYLFFSQLVFAFNIDTNNLQSKLLVNEPYLIDSTVLKIKDNDFLNKLIRSLSKGDSVYLKGELEQSCKFYSEGLALSSSYNLKLQKIIFLNRLGFANYWLANISQAYKYYDQSVRIFKDIGRIPDTLAYIETIYFNKILSVKNEGSFKLDFDSLIDNIDTNNYKGSKLTKLYFLISNIYFIAGKNSEMKKVVAEMKGSLYQCKESRELWFFLERLTEANYYMHLNLIEIEGKFLMELYTQINFQPEFIKYQFEIKSLLARYYCDKNQFQNAIEILENIESYVNKDNHPYFFDYYLLLGYCYFMSNDHLRPNKLYNHAGKIIMDHKITDFRLALVYIYKSSYDYLTVSKPDETLGYLKKSAEILDHSEKLYLKSYIYWKIGTFYYKHKNFPMAIDYYSLQLNDLDSLLLDNSYLISQIPRLIQNQIPVILKYRGNSYYFLAEKRNFDKELLIKAYDEKRKLLALWMKLYDYLESYEDYRINVMLSIKETYDDQIEFGYKLYEVTNDKEWLDKIFILSQKSKAFMLKSFLNDRIAQRNSGIPEELVQKSLRLRKELDELQYTLNSENIFSKNRLNNDGLISTVIDKYSEYNYFIKSLEKEYPEYASLKKKDTELSVKQIQQKLNADQALIEYQIGYAGLYTFYIDRNIFKTYFHPIPNDATDDLSNQILKYRDLIIKNSDGNVTSEDFEKMTDQSKLLYNLLIGPFKNSIKNKRLVIVPDRDLNTIPFETLIDSSNIVKYSNSNVKTPYLVRENPISYLYSSSLLKDKFASILKNPKYAGFAPDYNSNNTNEIRGAEALETLPGALDELVAARKYFRGKIFKGENATKQNFFTSISGYDIIHLAMHTSIDENEPMNSELIFSPDITDKNGQMRAYEVYSHENNIKMAVLSACNTGSGKVRAGEGIFNIARAFFLAGVPNVVLTQWSISDKSSAKLMSSFYKYLAEKYPADVALQKAKIDFLDKGDPVKMHPYYWSGYITYGTCILIPDKNNFYLILIIAVILIIGVALIIRKFKT
jgi:CHAT domain-containing protein